MCVFISVSKDLGNILDKLVIFGTKRRYQEVKDVLGDLEFTTINPKTVTQIQVPPPIITIPASPRPSVSYPQSLIETLPSGIKLEMIILPAGTFMMGSDEYDWEKPKHQVTLKQFAIGKYPVTQEQYQAVVGTNPSRFRDIKNPVEQVSWDDAQIFC